MIFKPKILGPVFTCLGALALSAAAAPAQVEAKTAVPWSTNFSNFETKVPWIISAEDIAALTAKTPNRNWDEARRTLFKNTAQ